MRLLALDTAAATQSVALLDGELVRVLIGARREPGESDRVLCLIERSLEIAGTSLKELDAVAVSRGPGSLTGLRVGLGTARGLAAGAGKRLIGVSTLQALAAGLGGGAPILALLDAGRGEVYGGFYEPGNPPRPLGDERIGLPEEFAAALAGRRLRIAGSGAARFRDLFPDAAWPPAAGEEFFAAGVGRVAVALLKSAEKAPCHPDALAAEEDEVLDIGAAPRYLRRERTPLRFEG